MRGGGLREEGRKRGGETDREDGGAARGKGGGD